MISGENISPYQHTPYPKYERYLMHEDYFRNKLK